MYQIELKIIYQNYDKLFIIMKKKFSQKKYLFRVKSQKRCPSP